MSDTPNTLLEAVRYFSDRDTCEAYMRKIRWPSGTIECPNCGAKGKRIGEDDPELLDKAKAYLCRST